MESNEIDLRIELDPNDDTVGSFDPGKVITQLQRAFPDVEIDPTDHQQVRLLKELEAWSQIETDHEMRGSMTRSSWSLFIRMGPTYRFVLPFPIGHRVKGSARRYSVWFTVPIDLPAEYRERLKLFLQSIRMGEPMLSEESNDSEG